LVIYIAISHYHSAVMFSVSCVYSNSLGILLPPLPKCNNPRDHGQHYELPDLWSPNSPDLIPVDYLIWDII